MSSVIAPPSSWCRSASGGRSRVQLRLRSQRALQGRPSSELSGEGDRGTPETGQNHQSSQDKVRHPVARTLAHVLPCTLHHYRRQRPPPCRSASVCGFAAGCDFAASASPRDHLRCAALLFLFSECTCSVAAATHDKIEHSVGRGPRAANRVLKPLSKGDLVRGGYSRRSSAPPAARQN